MPPIETDQGTAGTQSGHASVLTRSDFSGAIRDALRSYVQTDLLAGNALLEAQVVARGTPGTATPQVLKALLAQRDKVPRAWPPLSLPITRARPPVSRIPATENRP